jgi:hypothetical protein
MLNVLLLNGIATSTGNRVGHCSLKKANTLAYYTPFKIYMAGPTCIVYDCEIYDLTLANKYYIRVQVEEKNKTH